MPSSEIPGLDDLFEGKVSSVERIYGGRNNRLFRVTCQDSHRYVVKLYFGDETDYIKRLDNEYASSCFLWGHGLDRIPKPVAVNKELGWTVFEYIEGQQIDSSTVAPADIDDLTDFLVRLKQLTNQPDSGELPTAWDSFFSVQETVTAIELRFDQLSALTKEGSQHPNLHRFLQNDYAPAHQEIKQWCESTFKASGGSFDSVVALSQRTLSPSDFGFHNALRRPSGQVVYLDFEYFGWDDPGKMISDFLHHPGMEISASLKQRFVENMFKGLGDDPDLNARLPIVYPLFGLKWCLIILNEFLPQKLSRRGFATEKLSQPEELQSTQLAKAKGMLKKVVVEYQRFPYGV